MLSDCRKTIGKKQSMKTDPGATFQEIEQDERMTYCRYMAAWLPHEPHYEEILNRIAGAAQRANDKEDATETGILFSAIYVICRGAGAVIWKCLRFPEM